VLLKKEKKEKAGFFLNEKSTTRFFVKKKGRKIDCFKVFFPRRRKADLSKKKEEKIS